MAKEEIDVKAEEIRKKVKLIDETSLDFEDPWTDKMRLNLLHIYNLLSLLLRINNNYKIKLNKINSQTLYNRNFINLTGRIIVANKLNMSEEFYLFFFIIKIK